MADGPGALEPNDAGKASEGGFTPIKALQKGLLALDMVLGTEAVRTVDIAARLDVDKGTASRIVHTLIQGGYATRLQDRRIGPGPRLARSARRGPPPRIRQRARPLLETIVRQTQETAHVGILADDQVLYLDSEVPDVMLRVDRPAGSLAPMHCTALGKVFLAFGNVPLPASLLPLTPRSVTDPAILTAELERARARGFVLDDEGVCLGVRCVAAPLRDEASGGDVVAAISVSGPASRIDLARLEAFGDLLRDVAARF